MILLKLGPNDCEVRIRCSELHNVIFVTRVKIWVQNFTQRTPIWAHFSNDIYADLSADYCFIWTYHNTTVPRTRERYKRCRHLRLGFEREDNWNNKWCSNGFLVTSFSTHPPFKETDTLWRLSSPKICNYFQEQFQVWWLIFSKKDLNITYRSTGQNVKLEIK